jgi:methylated-DNA-protein-cysteine methyltransferase-like protein
MPPISKARIPASTEGAAGPTDADRIRFVVARIPSGRVATYGEIADWAGLPRRARLVGRVLAGLPAESRLPWHRVVAAGGRLAVRGGGEALQRQRLEREGVRFRGDRVDLPSCHWQPAGPAS